MKFVSFVLPAYKAKFLKQAIDSILNQRYRNFELIVVDDASPEDIESVILSYHDKRIKYYRNKENIGGISLVKQWNHCIQYAEGDYLVLAADDDLYHPDFLHQCVSLSQKYPHVDLIRTRVEQIDEYNNLIGIDGIMPQYCSKYQYVYYWLNATAFTCIGNYMFKTDVLKRKLFIDFPCAFGSDTASTIEMAENGVANTKDMLFKFRISSIHLSSNKGRLSEKLEAITMLFTWLKNLNYTTPTSRIDQFCHSKVQWTSLYPKCKYDYYNLVIKHLPLSKIHWISKCRLSTTKDKCIMSIRFIFDKIFKRVS